MQNEPLEVTLKVTRVFESLGVSYLIGGSLASTLYGMVRTTQDADIVADWNGIAWAAKCPNGSGAMSSAS